MLDALLRETLEYKRQIDCGFQLGARNRYADLDLWINWNLLNTPEYMEYLDGGINLFVYLLNFILNLQRYWTHHGGQLYQVGDTKNNYSLALEIEHFYKLESGALQKIGGRLSYLAFHLYSTGTVMERGIDINPVDFGIVVGFCVEVQKLFFELSHSVGLVAVSGDLKYDTHFIAVGVKMSFSSH